MKTSMKAFDRGGNTLEKTSLRGIQGMTLAKSSAEHANSCSHLFSSYPLCKKKKRERERERGGENILG
ncbi:hypothetical protein POVWA1_010940 [Plasmodium ovale wallikeri]|uniref:Uncharacterized protein n=1 Tax=Plasmodium ovale wallikeri TaxID=864142 RepID=A0A1A8YKY5_PLAOA|nr:hypothetical protein POVWA1_010940 [Plasmodium ovale wallikeri]